jgi:hypothetical protein
MKKKTPVIVSRDVVPHIDRLSGPKKPFIERLEGLIRIVGDIESPLEPPEAWECLR